VNGHVAAAEAVATPSRERQQVLQNLLVHLGLLLVGEQTVDGLPLQRAAELQRLAVYQLRVSV
jgi:hypothetical protein